MDDLTLLSNTAEARVLVIGDVMLDRYWFGEVSRISPEAPVPVVKVVRAEDRLGGAANVARNIVAIGGRATLSSVVGADDAGRALQRLLDEGAIDAALQIDPTIETTIKLRVIGRQQQLLRIDFERAPRREVLAANLSDFVQRLADCDVVVVSDYGKGGLAHVADVIARARGAGKPVLVDPKGDDYSRYRGATVITPNLSEFRQVVGGWRDEAQFMEKGFKLRGELDIEALLVTRSEEGMTLFSRGGVLHQSATAREVFDVSGAGDTVIATLATLVALGAPWEQAMRIANLAAGIVVGKLGTAVVTREEISAVLAVGG